MLYGIYTKDYVESRYCDNVVGMYFLNYWCTRLLQQVEVVDEEIKNRKHLEWVYAECSLT